MAYIPPLNGGRLNASLSGNSTSAGAGYSLLSTGTLYLAGGNNITLSQNGASVTISGANAPSGSINFSASNTSANLASVTFSNSNGVSFGLNAGVVTASHNGITSQTNQTIGVYATGANTTGQSSSNTMDARSFVVSGQGMYAGMSGSTLQLSVATTYAASNHSHGNPTLNLTNLSGTTASASNGLTLSLSAGAQSSPNISLYALGNTTQNSSTQLNASNLSFNGLGAATMGYSNGSIQVSVPTQTVENQSIGIGGTAGGSSATAGSVSVTGAQLHYNLYAGSNITLSQSANGASGSLSIYGGAGGGGGTLSMYGLGNTTQNSSTSLDARSVSLNGLGAMTVGYSNGSVQLSAPAVSQLTYTGAVSMSSNGSTISIGAPVQTNQTLGLYAVSNTTQSTSGTMDARTLSFQGAGAASVGISNGSIVISAPNAGAGNVTFSAGASSAGRASIVFSNSNGVSFGMNGSTITASAAGGAGGVALYDGANSISSGTASISAQGALTASINAQTLSLSVPATSSLSATGAVSISTNGSTISIGVPVQATLSRFVYPNEYLPLNTIAAVNNSISFNYLTVPQNVSASQFRAIFSVSAGLSATTNTYALSASVGVYTRTGSTLSQASSGSQSWSGTFSTNGTASIQGIREFTIPINIAMSPGEYWYAMGISSSSSNAAVGYSQFVVSNQQTTHLNPGRFGAAVNTTQLLYPMHGMYSATSGALPVSATLNDINGNSTRGSAAMFWFDVRNYTVL